MTEKLLGLLLVLALVSLGLMSGVMLDFVFFYPLFMSFVWMIGGVYFYFHWERRGGNPKEFPQMSSTPFVSILIPCYNEGENVADTIAAACASNYPDFEVIAINDGSRDNTGAILDRLTTEHPRLRVVHLAENQGKAMALRMGTLAAKSEYLVCVDGDSLLDKNAVAYLVKPLIDNPRVGAVTGNPRIRTRSTLLGKVQVGEFSSIIGLIKRAQRVYGNIFTISGVIAGFRRAALHNTGYWSLNMITEDIDVSWMQQMKHWQIQYEPCAMCWILMPETFKGLWKQRLRWAQGGAEVYFKNIQKIWQWSNHRMWILILDYCLCAAWSYSFLLSILLWSIGKFVAMPEGLNVPAIYPPEFWGILLATVCIFQFSLALFIESRYEPDLLKSIGWTIWYPLVFWIIAVLTTLVGFPKAFLKHHEARGVWVTTDRGLK
jgi:biofilm PGA synthesis N-glycosyltransferase PgaC